MIYLREFLTILPATPRTHDALCDLIQEALLPAWARVGARMRGAFMCHRENWGQVVHLTEYDDLSVFDACRVRARNDPDYVRASAALAELAPEQRSELLEPIGPIAPAVLQAAIEISAQDPVKVYTFAELELAPGKTEVFEQVLAATKDSFPIVAALRDIAGNPRRVHDLWKGALAQDGYAPATDTRMAFFGPLRELAPREYLMHLYPLPYSPLR